MIKKVTISSKDITPKQWSVLLLELNTIKRAWKSFAHLDIKSPDFARVVKWGSRRYDEKEKK
tara:strand:+ start:20 stop:205 length:186 start_codon:yes stop_codon:yes gene_type:complete